LEKVQVVVLYYGYLSDIIKCNNENLLVSSDFEKGIQQIKDMLEEQYALKRGSYITMINDIPLVQMQKNKLKNQLTKTDVIKIIPLISGG